AAVPAQPGKHVEHAQQPDHSRHPQPVERAGHVARIDLAFLDVQRAAAVVHDVDGNVAAHRTVPGRAYGGMLEDSLWVRKVMLRKAPPVRVTAWLRRAGTPASMGIGARG